MKSQIRMGRVLGIRIGLHYSWFVIALLLLFSFSAGFHRRFPGLSPAALGSLALLTSALFFLSLLLHELAHCLVARRYGLQVREITLFALGGVSQIEGDLPDAKAEFRIAVAGPLTSAAIGAIALTLRQTTGCLGLGPVASMLSWIGYINLTLAAFNMLPGYPMDGGRVLRAFLWWKTGNAEQATHRAAMAGSALAVAFIVTGIFQYFHGAGLGGLWLVFLGWFLLQASRESYVEYGLREQLRSGRVADLMTRDAATVDARLSVQDFIDHQLLRTGRRCFLVTKDGAAVGLVTPHELRRVDRDAWPATPLESIMRPLSTTRSLAPDDSLLEAMNAMVRADLNQLPVVREGHIEGLLSRAEVLAYIQTWAELQER